MAKIKNKKRNLAENVNNKKLQQHNLKKKLNPFEVHVNKEKIQVLGRKLKNDRGLPGVSRAKALKKRKETLLQEYQVLGKANKFTDRRIGEQNRLMNEEDRSVARFTAERVKKHNRKSIFNLAEDEILTHRGQTLSEIEKFDDPKSDDDDDQDNNDAGKLESNFVKEAHFGGGLFKNTGSEGVKSHKDLIEQLIAESKKRKAEKQKIKEQTLELTEKLDSEWKDLLPLVNSSNKKTEAEQTVDDYDKVMRELKFEARGVPSNRLKSENEIAQEEKDQLEKLEQDRLKRMKGFVDEDVVSAKHKSADDLDDNFEYEELGADVMLSYDTEGVANVDVQAELNGQVITANNNDKFEEHSNEDGKEDNMESNDVEDGNEDNNEEEEESEESDDNFSDLKSEESESEEETEANLETNSQDKDIQEMIKVDLQQRKGMMEKARKELPYTFALPNSYEELYATLQQYDCNSQSVAIERMIKCNHPSLGEQNKERLGLLFVYLLQYVSDISSKLKNKDAVRECFDIYNNVVPLMFDLAQLNNESAQNSMKELVKEKQAEFRKNQTKYPDLDIILFLKLISCLFPTSDFRHPVVTPSLIYMEQLLNKCKVKIKRDAAYGLFLVNLILEFTTLSKRFSPISLNFLAGILHMAIPKRSVKIIKVLPPFKTTSNLLVLNKSYKNNTETFQFKLNIDDILEEKIDESFKIRALYASLKMLQEIHNNLIDLPSLCEIFAPIYRYLCMIPFANYPEIVYKESKILKKLIKDSELNRKLIYLVTPKIRPKALRLYEPQIERVYDVKKHKVQSREKAERAKLLHKFKREKKGALREIRRDQAFLGRLKINERIKSDTERRERVKKIYAEASIQQSELNAISRTNKRFKK